MKLVKRRRFVVTKVALRDFGGDKSYQLKVDTLNASLRLITIRWKKEVEFSYYEDYGYTAKELEDKVSKLTADVEKYFGSKDCGVWVHYREDSHYLGIENPEQELDNESYEVVE